VNLADDILGGDYENDDFNQEEEEADDGEEKGDTDVVDPVKTNPGSLSRRHVKPIHAKSKIQ